MIKIVEFIFSLFLMCFLSSLARADTAPAMTPITVAKNANFASCSEWKMVGLCYSPVGIPTGILVTHYVPTTYVDLTKKPGDTTMSFAGLSSVVTSVMDAATKDIKSIAADMKGKNHSFEAHVYKMPDKLVKWANIGMSCVSCDPSYAKGRTLKEDNSPSLGTVCGSLTQLQSNMMNLSNALKLDGYTMDALYFSEFDALNWRSGCRDASIENVLTSNAAGCSVSAAASSMNMNVFTSKCIKRWGPLYPRQFRDIGLSQCAAAAKTGYRAMHIASSELETLENTIDLNGKMQLAYPEKGSCFNPGDYPLPSDTETSKDGRYGFIYWRPVICCIPFGQIAGNCVQ